MRNEPLIRTARRLAESSAVVFLVAVALRVWTASSLPPEQAWDYFYQRNEAVHIAWAMASGHGFSSPWPNTPLLPTAQQPPIYPALLAGIFKLCGAYSSLSLWVAIGVNAAFAGGTAILLLRVGKRTFGSLAGILAAWFWASSLLEAAASVRLWESSLSALLLLVALCLLQKLPDVRQLQHWILFGLLAGIAALTNTTLLALFPLFWLWLWYVSRRRGDPSKRRLWASILTCALVISPWIIRNYAVFHRLVPIRDNFGLELWVGNGHDSNFSIDNVTEFNQLGEIPFMEAKRHRAWQFIRAHPSEFVRATAWRALRFWALPERSSWPWISILAWAGMLLALKRKCLNAVPFAIVMIVFPLVYYVTHAHVTYRYPIEPEILLLAAYALVTLAESTRRSSQVKPQSQ